MGHKENHGMPLPPGPGGTAQRGPSAAGEHHHAARRSDVESVGGGTGGEPADVNCDTLWVDIGGEG